MGLNLTALCGRAEELPWVRGWPPCEPTGRRGRLRPLVYWGRACGAVVVRARALVARSRQSRIPGARSRLLRWCCGDVGAASRRRQRIMPPAKRAAFAYGHEPMRVAHALHSTGWRHGFPWPGRGWIRYRIAVACSSSLHSLSSSPCEMLRRSTKGGTSNPWAVDTAAAGRSSAGPRSRHNRSTETGCPLPRSRRARRMRRSGGHGSTGVLSCQASIAPSTPNRSAALCTSFPDRLDVPWPEDLRVCLPMRDE